MNESYACVHLIPEPADCRPHDMLHGGDCWCEPMVRDYAEDETQTVPCRVFEHRPQMFHDICTKVATSG